LTGCGYDERRSKPEGHARSPAGGEGSMDIVWLGAVGAFFLLTWGFVLLAEKL
jgi:hypothetical protein